MRALIVALLGCSMCTVVCGQDDPEKELSWTKAFSPITASQANSKLAVILITNNQALIESGDKNGKKDSPPQQSMWCKANFEYSFRRAAAARNELTTLCSLGHQQPYRG